MKPTFHNSNEKLKFIRAEAAKIAGEGLKDVSGVKKSGNVFVRFRSTAELSADEIAFEFFQHMDRLYWAAQFDRNAAMVSIRIESVIGSVSNVTKL